MSLEENIKSLSTHVAELYFVKREYKHLSTFLSENVTWIGTGKNEICLNQEEALQFFEKEKEVFDGNFEIIDQWYECKTLSHNVCLVMAVLNIKLNTETEVLSFETLRFSALWKRDTKDDTWKIYHIHNSIPDAAMEENTYFNLSVAQSNYQRISESIRKASYTDSLTKLYNVQGFEYEVDQLLRKYPEKTYAVIKFGIKNFRFVNRRYSFKVGDEVLKNIAKNLIKTLKSDEVCGRIEKDNFAMLYHAEHKEKLEQRLLKVREQLIDKKLLKKLDMEIHLKAGVYIIKDNREYIKDMLDKALIALQSVSQTLRGNHHHYFEESMLQLQYFNSEVLEDAPKAMETDEFQLYIQPQFDIRTKKFVAGEALTRWKLSNGEIRMPDEFIHVFEEKGMILSFDFYMLEKVCKQMKKWIDQGLVIPPISINQSRLHIQEHNYLNDFCSIVDKYDIPHNNLVFELTESAFIEDSGKMMLLAKDLHRQGFQLAIDDFGTGYASINLLTEISADILKLDRVLLNDCANNPKAKIVMKTLIELAHQLNMKIIAEGIESEEQLNFLKELQCDIGQGFLIGQPMKAESFMENWIKRKCVV